MNPVIEKIKLTKEQQKEVNKILKGEPVQIIYHFRTRGGHIIEHVRNKKLTGEMAKRRLTQLLGGMCLCGFASPDYKVIYDVGDGATRIERYCQKCYDKWKSR